MKILYNIRSLFAVLPTTDILITIYIPNHFFPYWIQNLILSPIADMILNSWWSCFACDGEFEFFVFFLEVFFVSVPFPELFSFLVLFSLAVIPSNFSTVFT